jgi:PIN like domain
MLRAVGFQVYVHKEYFKDDTDDDIWIPSVQGRGWVIFSNDKRIARDPINVRAVLHSKAQVIMTSNNNTLPEFWGAAFIVGRMRISDLLVSNPRPVFIQIGEHARDHVQLVKQHLTHPGKPDEQEAISASDYESESASESSPSETGTEESPGE